MWLCLLAMLVSAGGCASNMTTAQEIQLGEQAAPKFEQEGGGVYPDPEVQAYVQRVGMSMAAYAGRNDLPWRYRVLSSSQVNAFALPGGFIYITQGLLFRLQNEAQLAGVLGHETGHVAHRDTVHQMQREQNTQLAAGGLGIIGALFGFGGVGDLANIGAQLVTLKYDRNQEKTADMAGLKFMSMGGYNPEGLVQVMQILEHASGGGGPQFLSTHPDPGNRVQYLDQTIQQDYRQQAYEGVYGQDEFRRHILAHAPR